MKFALNEYVKIKATGEVGEVTMYTQEISINHRERKETNKYLIKNPKGYIHSWYYELELTHLHEFDTKFELGLIDLLIDVNLLVKNLDIVKQLYKQKQKLMEEGK